MKIEKGRVSCCFNTWDECTMSNTHSTARYLVRTVDGDKPMCATCYAEFVIGHYRCVSCLSTEVEYFLRCKSEKPIDGFWVCACCWPTKDNIVGVLGEAAVEIEPVDPVVAMYAWSAQDEAAYRREMDAEIQDEDDVASVHAECIQRGIL